jgi:TonB family protein
MNFPFSRFQSCSRFRTRISLLQISFAVSLLLHGAAVSVISLTSTSRSAPESDWSGNSAVLEIVRETYLEIPPVVAVTFTADEMPEHSPPVVTAIETPPPAPVPREASFQFELWPRWESPLNSEGELEPPEPARTERDSLATTANDASATEPQTVIQRAGPPIPDLAFYVKPAYPREARKLRQQGLVVLAVSISEEGRPAGVSVLQSSGFALLDESAVKAVRKWRFTPANASVKSEVEIPIRFRLDQRPEHSRKVSVPTIEE